MPKRFQNKLYAGIKGENQRDLAERISPDSCVSIENYHIEGDGIFVTRKGKTTKYTIANCTALYCIEPHETDTLLVGWTDGTNSYISKYTVSIGAFYTLKTYTSFVEPIFIKSAGEYAFACNGTRVGAKQIQCLYPTGKFCTFKNQTANFSVGETITNADGGTATILAQSDGGTGGYLVLTSVVGTWTTNKLITTATGSATQDGDLYDAYELGQSPRCKFLELIQNNNASCLLAGNTETSRSILLWSAAYQRGAIPFVDWTLADNQQVGKAYFNDFVVGGEAKSACFHKGFIYAVYERALNIFHIENVNVDNGTSILLLQVIKTDYSYKGRGGYKIIATDYGVFYTAEDGVYQIPVGSTNFGGINIAEVLQKEEGVINLDFTDSDIVWDGQKRIYITAKSSSQNNNIVLVYDAKFQSWTRITGWDIKRFCNLQDSLYALGSIFANIALLNDGYNDDGFPINYRVLFKANDGGDITSIKKTRKLWIKGKLSPSSAIKVSVHTWDKRGAVTQNKKQFMFYGVNESEKDQWGYGKQAIGETTRDIGSDILRDNIGNKSMRCNGLSKWQLEVYSSGEEYHELHLVEVEYDLRRKIRTNSLTSV